MREPSAPAPGRVADLADQCCALLSDPAAVAAGSAAAATLRADGATLDVGLGRLVRTCGLSAFERDVIALVGLPEEHEALAAVARRLHPLGEPRLSPGGIAAALGLDVVGRQHLRTALEEGPLRRLRIVRGPESAPLPERGLALAPALWSALRGLDAWPDGLQPLVVPPLDSPWLDATALAAVLGEAPRVVLVTGPRGRPPEELAAAVAAAADRARRAAVFLSAAVVSGDAAALASAHALARDAVPVLVGTPTEPPLPEHPGPVVVCATVAAPGPLDDRPVVALDLRARDLAESAAMWRDLAPELDGEAAHLAGLLRVDRRGAARAVADARAARNGDGELGAEAIVARVRRRTTSDLPASVRLVQPEADWGQLVAPTEAAALLHSVVDRVRGQVRVLHDWGFATTRGSPGVRLLLSGPPGTGKTLSAEIIAAALGLDLLVVDLAALVSKWLGETEKNIAEVFDAAERCQAVLFFDEADAVFGKRTDAGDAQARWANLETAYLLGRIDAFDGLVVLATNLRSNIDDAFVRRLDVIVDLEEPTADERRALWPLHLPPRAPLAPDVDLDRLAGLYEVTGAVIRNACLSAAFMAAAADVAITQQLLVLAVEREYRKSGRSFPGRPRALTAPLHGGT